jgi:uncharacterized membrane protein (DUF4010 family)
MATVILPLLPEGPFGPLGGVRPRQLWALVLFFSGLSFVGYFARRTLGRDRGYAIAGTLGGILSSTSVTLTFARLSQNHQRSGRALAAGTLGANAALFPRVLVATAVLAPALAQALWPALIAPFVIGLALALRGLGGATAGAPERSDNPLQFRAALQMTVLFQVVLFGVALARQQFGETGLYGSAIVLGLADMDALTISMAQLTRNGTDPTVTATAIVIGLIANTAVKLSIALVIGRGSFRPLTVVGLVLIGAALVAALLPHQLFAT